MSTYTLSSKAYLKLFFHAAKHPHQPVNGVLVGSQPAPNGPVTIYDAIPLLHHWTSLSPMMEIGLDLAGQYALECGFTLVGYYQACERLDDTSLAPVGEVVASKVKTGFADAIAFVIDGEKFGSNEAALIPYTSTSPSSSWRPVTSEPTAFTTGSRFQLASPDLPKRAGALVRDDYMHQAFGDFDDHLEDVSIDWLRNTTCLPADI